MACSQPRLLHRHRWRDARPGAAQGQTRPAGRRLQEVRRVHRGAEDGQVAAAAGLHGGGDAGGAYRESCKLQAGAKAPFEISTRVGSNEGVGQNSVEVIKIPGEAAWCTRLPVQLICGNVHAEKSVQV